MLTLKEKKKIIAQCLDLGVLSFSFIGGETSLSKDLPELIRACRPGRTYITLATNGYGFDEDKIRYFSDLGVDEFDVSIDSWFPEEHDTFRGKTGSYDSAIKTLNLCKKVGVNYHIGIVIYKNYTKSESFKKLVDYAISTKTRLGMIPAVPLGKWEANHDNLITREDRHVMDTLHSKYPFITSDNYGNKNHGCPAFQEVLNITPYGDVLPCDFIHISFGNLKNESLRTILDRGRQLSEFDGGYQGCLAAESKEFIESYLSKTYEADPYPVKAVDIFEKSLFNQDNRTGAIMKYHWEKEVILITGASSGLGKALAIKGRELNATLILTARSENELKELSKELSPDGDRVHIFPFDLNDLEEIPDLYKTMTSKTGLKPTILINNAGYSEAGFVQNTPVNTYMNNFKVNFFAPIALIQSVLPDMLERRKGKIINIINSAMFHSFPGTSSYCSSKAALGALHESLKAELSGLAVKTLYVNPGVFKSNYVKNIKTENRLKDFTYNECSNGHRSASEVADAIFDAVETGKEEINLNSLMGRIGDHLAYWAPGILDKIVVHQNRELIEKRPLY